MTAALPALLARLSAALPAEPGTAAGDLFALVRGMVDAAGERNGEDLERRVLRAVHGYLGVPQAVA